MLKIQAGRYREFASVDKELGVRSQEPGGEEPGGKERRRRKGRRREEGGGEGEGDSREGVRSRHLMGIAMY